MIWTIGDQEKYIVALNCSIGQTQKTAEGLATSILRKSANLMLECNETHRLGDEAQHKLIQTKKLVPPKSFNCLGFELRPPPWKFVWVRSL